MLRRFKKLCNVVTQFINMYLRMQLFNKKNLVVKLLCNLFIFDFIILYFFNYKNEIFTSGVISRYILTK